MLGTKKDIEDYLEFSEKFIIVPGVDTKMYTLKGWFDEGFGSNWVHIQNLSTDFNTALQKARDLVGDNRTIETKENTLNPIFRNVDDVLTFGKHKHKRVSDLSDTGYLKWLSKGGPIEKECPHTGHVSRSFFLKLDSPIKRAARNRLFELNSNQQRQNTKVIS